MMYDGRNPYGRRGGYIDRLAYDMARRDYSDYDMDYARGRGRDRRYDYADYADYDDYNRDYHKAGKMLDERTLEMWGRALMSDIEPKDQMKFKMDAILKKAEEMGIRFDKVTPQEYHVTVLMMVTDYNKTLGLMNIDTYLKLAKEWLCDPDAGVKYGEKLAAYYNHIVNV